MQCFFQFMHFLCGFKKETSAKESLCIPIEAAKLVVCGGGSRSLRQEQEPRQKGSHRLLRFQPRDLKTDTQRKGSPSRAFYHPLALWLPMALEHVAISLPSGVNCTHQCQGRITCYSNNLYLFACFIEAAQNFAPVPRRGSRIGSIG